MSDRRLVRDRYPRYTCNRKSRPPMPSPDDSLAGMEISQTTSGLSVVQQRIEGTEFIAHLGADEFFDTAIDEFIDQYPTHQTLINGVWGRTAVGKKTLIGQGIHILRNSEIMNAWLEKNNLTLDIAVVGFAESANLAKLLGGIDPSKPHGSYNNKEYRAASVVMWGEVQQQVNNFEGPRWLFVEATGPSAYIHPVTRDIDGQDRGMSVMSLLGENFSGQTKVAVIDRGPELIEKIMVTREKIEKAKPKQLPDVLEEGGIQIADEGKVIDLRKLPAKELARIQRELIATEASSMGVWMSNRATDLLKERMGVNTDAEMWVTLREFLGFSPYNFTILKNEPTETTLTVHHEQLNASDPVLKKINLMLGISTPARRRRYFEMMKAG